MKKVVSLLSVAITLSVILFSCQKNDATIVSSTPQLPTDAHNYTNLLGVPQHMQHLQWNLEGESMSDNTATLGRVLFYDTQLSLNNSVSCGSCHKQTLGFADNKAFSRGFEDKMTTRNSMQLVNFRDGEGFFWDLRTWDLRDQVTMPVFNHLEMGFEEMDDLITKLSAVEYYPDLFAKAYGTSEVTEEGVSQALSAFLLSMVSYDSKYDRGMTSDFRNFNAQELRGKQLFFEELTCGNCHSNTDFKGLWTGQTANIGLSKNYADKGLGELLDETDAEVVDLTQSFFPGSGGMDGHFKIPSLRNVGLTAPYMHDGRFATLEEVVDHYSDDIADHPNLDWSLTEFADQQNATGVLFDQFELNNNGIFPSDLTIINDDFIGTPFVSTGTVKAKRFNLSPQDKRALVAFLETLTDDNFTRDVKFSDPFRI